MAAKRNMRGVLEENKQFSLQFFFSIVIDWFYATMLLEESFYYHKEEEGMGWIQSLLL
ncbi:hypothetical protein [Bacillus sp. 1P06AnD]|uniref:hypothetical protein n=1 Tax=Bacillus sp. 1P06AnD TaxID=3132208 RepID=UPI0039A21091